MVGWRARLTPWRPQLEIKLNVHRSHRPELAAELEAQVEVQRAKRAELEKVLEDMGTSEAPSAAPAKKEAEPKSEFATFVKNMATGFVTVSVYFADIISDLQVLFLLYDSGNLTWAALSLFFLIAQFLAIYVRVLPYLRSTFGPESRVTVGFTWFGFPIGLLILDVMMFLEPFGLLAVLPLPMWFKTFIPAYTATRSIAEVFIESLPQTLLQSYILLVVMNRVHSGAGAASAPSPSRTLSRLYPSLPHTAYPPPP